MMTEHNCRHFTGIHRPPCEKGVHYDDIVSIHEDAPRRRFYCIDSDASNQCSLYEPYTKAELKLRDDYIRNFLDNLETFWDRRTTTCPHCKQHVTDCEQVGRCVYARPCGCRVGQGKLHDNWKAGA